MKKIIFLLVFLNISAIVFIGYKTWEDGNFSGFKKTELHYDLSFVATVDEGKTEDEEPFEEECEYVEMSAYDFIIQTMSAPQYWDYDTHVYPDSSTEGYLAKMKEQNGTGWILADENEAIFCRGYTLTLELNFSAFCATHYHSTVYLPDNPYHKVYLDRKDWEMGIQYDYLNCDLDGDEFKEIGERHQDDLVGEVLFSNYFGLAAVQEPDCRKRGFVYSTCFNTKDIILYYEEIFREAGCPLLNKPAGTLESYKNKTVRVKTTKKDDGLIHAVWQQEDFDPEWALRDDITWIKNIDEVLSFDVPQSDYYEEVEVFSYDENGERQEQTVLKNTYSPLFLTVALKVADADLYWDRSFFTTPEGIARRKKIQGQIEDGNGAFATYFIKPMTELIYGYNAVYFIDNDDVEEVRIVRFDCDVTFDEYEKTKYTEISFAGLCKTAIFYKYGDVFCDKETGDDFMEFQDSYDNIYLRFKEMCEYYNIEFPYADDYILNFAIYYDWGVQYDLGLK